MNFNPFFPQARTQLFCLMLIFITDALHLLGWDVGLICISGSGLAFML